MKYFQLRIPENPDLEDIDKLIEICQDRAQHNKKLYPDIPYYYEDEIRKKELLEGIRDEYRLTNILTPQQKEFLQSFNAKIKWTSSYNVPANVIEGWNTIITPKEYTAPFKITQNNQSPGQENKLPVL